MILKRKAVIYLLLALFCLFLGCLSINYDYDLFARLIVGERFIEDGILPFKDFLSYTPTHPWYDHEWGSGVVFYVVLKYLGSGGLLLLHSLLMFGIAYFVIKIQALQKHAYPVSLIFMGVFLYTFECLNPSLIRCHMFSFFFFAVFLYILEKNRLKGGTKLIWTLPLLIVVWNNLHGGVVSGLGLIFMYIIGAVFEKRPLKMLIAVLGLSFAVLMINPYGYKYLDFLFSATTKNREYITEWQSIFRKRHFLVYLPAGLYILFITGLNLRNINKTKKFDMTKIIVLLSTLYLGFAHVKLLSLALIAVSALCWQDICKLVKPLTKWMKKIEKMCYFALIVLICLIPISSPLYPRANFYKFPLYEIEFLLINNIKGNIITPFALGSYTSYKLYPNNLIYIDGRYEEVYYDKEFLFQRQVWRAEPNWQDIYKKYPTEILMPDKDSKLYEVLQNNSDWVHIFDGRLCGIFVKKGCEKKSYLQPEYGLDYYRRTMFSSKVFGENLKWKP